MATPGGSATATGLVLTLISVGAVVSSASGFALLLSFAGVLAGAMLIFAGVRVADDPTAPIGHAAAVRRVRALVCCLRRNLALVGLLLASTAANAATAAAADWETLLCAFALLLLGLSFINAGVLVLGEDDE